MTTYYINPTFANNGDGSTRTAAASAGAVGAFNAFPTITSGNTYLVEGGTTVTLSAQIATAANAVIGSIGTGKATLDATGMAASVFRLAGSNTEIRDLIIKTSANGGNYHGVYSASSGVSGCNIHHCDFIGPNSASLSVVGVTVEGIDGGPISIWANTFTGYKYSIVLTPDAVTGGCLIHDNTSENNIGPSSGDEEKFLHTGGVTLDWGGSLHIYNNHISGYGEYGIDLSGAAGARIYNNTFGRPNGRWSSDACICCGTTGAGGYAWIYNNIMLDAIYCGITIRGSTNNVIWSNLIKSEIPITLGTTGADSSVIFNNTLISTATIGVYISVGTHTLVQNVILGKIGSNGGAATLLRNKMTAAYDGSATYIDNGGNHVGDLMLTSGYAPTPASPAYGAGKPYKLGIVDAYSRRYHEISPSCGAIEQLPPAGIIN